MFQANLPKCSEWWCYNKDLGHNLQQKMLVDSSMIHNLPPPLSGDDLIDSAQIFVDFQATRQSTHLHIAATDRGHGLEPDLHGSNI